MTIGTRGKKPAAGQRTSARACVCVEQQQSTSSWNGAIEPARCVKSLNDRRQEQVELNGRRERVEEYNPRRRGAMDPDAMRSPGPREDHKIEVRGPRDPSSGNKE